MTVFVVLSYDSDAPYHGCPEGIFSTKRLALKKAIALRAEHEENHFRLYGFRNLRIEIKEMQIDAP